MATTITTQPFSNVFIWCCRLDLIVSRSGATAVALINKWMNTKIERYNSLSRLANQHKQGIIYESDHDILL